MKRTARALATAATLGLIGGLAPPAYAWDGYYGNGPAYYGDLAYDGYFAYEYPAYTGSDVTAISVDLFNNRFRHRRVVGPGVVYHRGEYPRWGSDPHHKGGFSPRIVLPPALPPP